MTTSPSLVFPCPYYGYNVHFDVEILTDSNGQTIGTYGYTAYGRDDETSLTGVA